MSDASKRFPYYDMEATLWMPTNPGTATGVDLLRVTNQPGYQIDMLLKGLAVAATLPRKHGTQVTITIKAVDSELP